MGRYSKPKSIELTEDQIKMLQSGFVRVKSVGNIFKEQEVYYFLPYVFKKDADGKFTNIFVQEEWPIDFKVDPDTPPLIKSINDKF